MGTGPFAVPSFDALLRGGHRIALVVTRPRPPVKSRKGPPPSPVRRWAEEHQLPIFDPPSINDAQAIEKVGSLDADLLMVCDYGQILKPAALATAPLGGINLHGSLLPAYRGAAPVQRALLGGQRQTGVSVIHMTPRLDGGPILCTRETPIGDQETAGELETRLAQIGVDAVLETVDQLAAWDGKSPIGVAQDPAQVSKAPRLNKSEGLIDWSRTVREVDCHVRGMQPWPTAFTFLKPDTTKPPMRLAIKQVSPATVDKGDAVAGQIVDGPGLLVATGDGVLEIKRLQPAGKREMDAEEFLRGHQIPGGTCFQQTST
jgi:methionyl-tRNA formyltransferase